MDTSRWFVILFSQGTSDNPEPQPDPRTSWKPPATAFGLQLDAQEFNIHFGQATYP